MLGEWCAPKFEGFGHCALRPRRAPRAELFEPGPDAKAARKLLRHACPAQPGVYGMIDADEQLIYVGVSKSLRHRLLSYFQTRPGDAKPRRIIARTVRLTWEPTLHELAAHLRESELIRRWTPRFNVRGQPGRLRRGYICLGRAPAPYAYLAAQPSLRTQDCFGPVSASHRMSQALARLNDAFGLRDCSDRPMIFSNQSELFPADRSAGCLRHGLGTCLGPCAALCSEGDYARQVRGVRAFLRGSDNTLLPKLEAAMQAAAAARQFERAATLRDIWQQIAWLREQVDRIAAIRRDYSFIYPTRDHAGRATWFFVRNARVAAIARAPRSHVTAARCWRLWDEVYESDRPVVDSLAALDQTFIVAAWFRRRPAELENTLTPDAARQLVGKHLDG